MTLNLVLQGMKMLLPMALAATAACDNGSSGGGAAPSATASASPVPSASSAPSPSAATSAAPSATSSASVAWQGRRHVGLAGVLLHGAYELPSLADDQKAPLNKADSQLYPDGAPSPWTFAKTFQDDLVAGIRASKIDSAKLQTDYVAFDKATQAGQAAEADALNTLHGALSKDQRQELCDAVKARRAARAARFPPPPADAGAPDWAKRRLDRLSAELTLDDGQKKAVGALIAKDTSMTPASMQARREATDKKVEALLTAFPADTFDAKKFDLGASADKTQHDMMERTATFATQLLPLLKPDQIAKFADRTERMGSPSRFVANPDQAPGPGGMGGMEEGPGFAGPR